MDFQLLVFLLKMELFLCLSLSEAVSASLHLGEVEVSSLGCVSILFIHVSSTILHGSIACFCGGKALLLKASYFPGGRKLIY